MEVAMYSKKIQPDPHLEAIRNKVLSEGTNTPIEPILQMIQKTSKIHAAFLFELEFEKPLQELCLSICETPNKISDAGWMKFGHYLNVRNAILRTIQNNNFNKEDPTYNVLLAYVQHEDSTIGKIIQALKDMQRYDVISKITDFVDVLANHVLSRYRLNNNLSVEDSSDYESLQSSEGPSFENSSSSITRDIIRPEIIPPAPFIFKNIQPDPDFIADQSQLTNDATSGCYETFTNIDERPCYQALPVMAGNETRRTHEMIQTKDNFIPAKKKAKNQSVINGKKRYGKVIMLTFANDGEKIAKEICREFRKERENFPKIGVVMLSEHVEAVNRDPERFISGIFHQVDYICPILTKGYLSVVARKERAAFASSIDARYTQYIYTLMNTYYISNGCLNDKIRCIIPDHSLSALQSNLLMAGPVFSAWVKSSEVDDLAVRLLKSKS